MIMQKTTQSNKKYLVSPKQGKKEETKKIYKSVFTLNINRISTPQLKDKDCQIT